MAKVTAAEFVEKWSRRTTQATEDYERGIRRVQEAPGVKAAQQADVMISNLQAAMPKWKERVQSVSLQQWQDKAIKKGKGRIAEGVNQASAGLLPTATALLAAVDNAKAGISGMKRGNLEQNLARANEFARKMAAAKIK